MKGFENQKPSETFARLGLKIVCAKFAEDGTKFVARATF